MEQLKTSQLIAIMYLGALLSNNRPGAFNVVRKMHFAH